MKLAFCWVFVWLSGLAVADTGMLDNVFGEDKRQAITSREYPWRAIGKINNGCTGTMVSRNLALTAAHCVIDPDTKQLKSNLTTFYPNYINGSSQYSSTISYVWWGTTDPDNYRADDWAILLLATNLGDQVGWMGIKGNGDDYKTVSLAGYSDDVRGGETAGVHVGCQMRGPTTSGFFLHDCHTARGASGGPIFVMEGKEAFITGLNVAEYRGGGSKSLQLPKYSDDRANISVSVKKFVGKVAELRQQYDSRK